MLAEKTQPKKKPLKVVIVGGGIAGLTLANALQRAPSAIECTVLEARDTVAPNLGAGIALLPNGSRILDQLDIYQDMERNFDPIVSSGVIDDKGRSYLDPSRINGAKLLGIRMGYPLALVQRKSLLKALKGQLAKEQATNQNRSKVLVNKRVTSIEQDDQWATIRCEDGTCYTAHVVVGADGVRSTVRQEMWRASIERGIGNINVDKERQSMRCEFKCLFGISKPVPGLGPGSSDDTWMKNKTIVVYSGENGKLFWFVYVMLDRVYGSNEIPRYTDKDAEALALEHLSVPLRPGSTVTFKDVWDAREVATMLPLEEANFEHWTGGRIACLGDSLHKMTPHSGAGGMMCMEAAAVLANSLHRLAAADKPLSKQQVYSTLKEYEHGPDNLHGRAQENVKASGDLGRLCALHTVAQRILVPYLVPLSLDTRIDMFCEMTKGAPMIDYLPVPTRSLSGTTPFNPTRGMGKELPSAKWKRALRGSVLFVVAYYSAVVIFGLVPFDDIKKILYGDSMYGDTYVIPSFYGISLLDSVSQVYNLEMIVSRAHCRNLMLVLFSDYAVYYAILLIEAARRANYLSILSWTSIWGMFHFSGIAFIGSIWKFLQYITNPISVFDAPDMRLTDMSYTITVLPFVLATHVALYMVGHLSPVSAYRQAAAHMWPMFPIWIAIGQFAASRMYPNRLEAMNKMRLYNVTADLFTIRLTILALVILATGSWQYTYWSSTGIQHFVDIFMADFPIQKLANLTMDQAYVEYIKFEWIFHVLSNLTWLFLLVWDLKASGMVHLQWSVLVLAAGIITVLGGPGALLGLTWLYREEILVRRKDKHAVVSRSHNKEAMSA